MIEQIRIVNFRQIADQTIELGQISVICGPNNSGKTALLQALSLFDAAVRAWGEQRVEAKKSIASNRRGVAINLNDLLNIPAYEFREIWRDFNIRKGIQNDAGKTKTENILIEVHARGQSGQQPWQVGFEFYYGRDTVAYARLAYKNDKTQEVYDFPEILLEQERIGYLPSAVGLNSEEDKLETGAILSKIGAGNAGNVLRNICFLLYNKEDKGQWNKFVEQIKQVFRITLNPPRHNARRGSIELTYNETVETGINKNISLLALGSGTRQALLLLSYLFAFPNTINLLDEPDAHLESIRQSNIYDRICDIARRNNSQLIIATHSESVINRAAPKDRMLLSVFGEFEQVSDTHKIDPLLREIGYEQLLTAKQRPCLLYFEGATDLEFIKAFAEKLGMKDFLDFIERETYTRWVGNKPKDAIHHFGVLRNSIPDLVGYALFDNLKKELSSNCPAELKIYQWQRNEIENYIPMPETLYRYAHALVGEDLLLKAGFEPTLREIVKRETPPEALQDKEHRHWKTTKISNDYLTPIFEEFFAHTKQPINTMEKSKFYQLVDFCTPALIDSEVRTVLEDIQRHLMQA